MIGTRPARLLALLLVGGVILFAPLASGAQEKFKSSWSARPENTKVTFQHVLEIPDVPGHTIRLYEYHRTWPDNPPIMAGLKVVEEVTRGFADAIVGSGLSRGYAFWRFENSDMMFVEFQAINQTVVNTDKGRKISFMGTSVVPGGTGKFQNVKGTARFSGSTEFDADGKVLKTGYSAELEYWFPK